MKPHASNWLDLSAYDLDVAKDMLKSQRYVYILKQTKDFRRWLEPKIKSGLSSGNLSKR